MSAAPSTPLTIVPPHETEVLDPIDTALRLEPYSDGRIWESATVLTEILAHTESMLRSSYEVGRRLLWTKEILGHGAFMTWCEANLPFSIRTVQNYMRIARFFVDHPGALRQLAKAGVKKTLLLTTLPSADIDDLLAGGQIADADIEDLADVPYLELKKAVEKLRKEKDALEEKTASLEGDLERTRSVIADQAIERTKMDQYAETATKKNWAAFCTMMEQLHRDMALLTDRWDEITPAQRATLVGQVEAMRHHVANYDNMLRNKIGEEVYGAYFAEAIQGAAQVGLPIPEDHQVLFFDSAKTR